MDVHKNARLTPLMTACRAAGSTALVGAPVAHGDGRAIGVLAVTGESVSVVYRKTCLGGDEPEHYLAGDRPAQATRRHVELTQIGQQSARHDPPPLEPPAG